jgi:hypothetical protein
MFQLLMRQPTRERQKKKKKQNFLQVVDVAILDDNNKTQKITLGPSLCAPTFDVKDQQQDNTKKKFLSKYRCS